VEPGAAKRSLHTKVSVLGGDMIVGSANADIRSYMMDSNNAIFIRNAPDLVGRYTRFIDSLLNDKARVNNVTNYFLVTDRSQILAEDRETFRHELVEKYGVDRHLDAAQIDRLEEKLIELLDAAYGLVGKILADDAPEEYQADFDRTFKPI
jgi:phosphatidylserine/phosphatidylglycerophosphate/cardiolipin synthase-like enzyme